MRYILTTFLLLFFYAYSGCAACMPADTLSIIKCTFDGEVPASFETSGAPISTECVDRGCEASAIDAGTRFRPQQLAFPAFALAMGGAGVRNHLIDTSHARERWTTVDDKLQYVPLGAYAVLGFIPGVKHRHNIGERFLAGATAYVAMTAVCQGAKRTISEPRPDTGARTSFPSGHTATAFCGAELTRIEYGNAYGAAAYAVAATTGVMRIVNNRHWCNDVLAGAGIGFLSAHVGYWLLPWEKRVVQRIFCRRDGLSASVSPFILAPTYQVETKAPSFTFAMTF